MPQFIGRNAELSSLQQILSKRSASLIVIKGRRRIGKSRLAQEFGRNFPQFYSFSGLAPEKNITATLQRNELIRQLREQKIPSSGHQDWGDLFYDLSQYTQKGRALIVLDEITWMGSLDPTFLGKLKIAWDQHFSKNDKLIMILSGSNSAWIDKNILSQTGFFGRISYRLTLTELPLYFCADFWGALKNKISAYEKLKLLAVTGGVPRYLEEIDPKQTAEQNIHRLCYQQEGVLFNEFDDIFNDLFQKRSERYKQVVEHIAEGKKTIESIAHTLGREKGGDLSTLLDDLCLDGFISRDFSWHFKDGKQSKVSQYRLSDNYLRFYLKYIKPFKHQIEINVMNNLPPGWESIIGLQFENLVINNRKQVHTLLNIPAHEIVMSNPYLQNETKQYRKCQVDYMIQTRFNVLYLCEIKFRKKMLGMEVVAEVQEKIKHLSVPKGFSIRPVLIHVNGVNDPVLASQFFANIIDFGELLVHRQTAN